ncbi:MAG: hypothetical protein IPO52_03780 [Gemmatimonadetes bacterium]|jgi:hypothetical protein|nr:hypothetical protein [Gemmatimonadota bacterium]MBP6444737.1 hypothetical protein [Gemmatimonadales bacterium]MBP6572294.1 hypothetical protein [Gemmatimonadales bacterium]MBP7622285.1 hypothetical protein [Gemmatimonadales bacterium]MBP9898124.1 hypothetical protein [Gemmatimonadales bacterium]
MRFLAPALLMLATAPVAAQTTAPAAPVAAPAPVKLTPEQETKLTALGKTYTRWFFAGLADSLAGVFDAGMLAKAEGVAGITAMMQQISERAGFPTKVLVEKLTYRNGMPQYWYEAEFSEFSNEPVVVRWVMNVEGKVIGSGMNPKSAAPKPDGV